MRKPVAREFLHEVGERAHARHDGLAVPVRAQVRGHLARGPPGARGPTAPRAPSARRVERPRAQRDAPTRASSGDKRLQPPGQADGAPDAEASTRERAGSCSGCGTGGPSRTRTRAGPPRRRAPGRKPGRQVAGSHTPRTSRMSEPGRAEDGQRVARQFVQRPTRRTRARRAAGACAAFSATKNPDFTNHSPTVARLRTRNASDGRGRVGRQPGRRRERRADGTALAKRRDARRAPAAPPRTARPRSASGTRRPCASPARRTAAASPDRNASIAEPGRQQRSAPSAAARSSASTAGRARSG